MRNWKTSLFGILGGVAIISNVASTAGINVGHWGGSDFLQVAAAVSTTLLGLYAKDHNVTGTETVHTPPVYKGDFNR